MITREEIIAVNNAYSHVQNPETAAIVLTGDNLRDEFTIVEQEIDRLLYRNYQSGESGGLLWKIPHEYSAHVPKLFALYAASWQVNYDTAGYLYFFWDE